MAPWSRGTDHRRTPTSLESVLVSPVFYSLIRKRTAMAISSLHPYRNSIGYTCEIRKKKRTNFDVHPCPLPHHHYRSRLFYQNILLSGRHVRVLFLIRARRIVDESGEMRMTGDGQPRTSRHGLLGTMKRAKLSCPYRSGE